MAATPPTPATALDYQQLARLLDTAAPSSSSWPTPPKTRSPDTSPASTPNSSAPPADAPKITHGPVGRPHTCGDRPAPRWVGRLVADRRIKGQALIEAGQS
jgi:hypothetical protein